MVILSKPKRRSYYHKHYPSYSRDMRNGICKAGLSKHFIQFAVCVISIYMVMVCQFVFAMVFQGGNMKVHENSFSRRKHKLALLNYKTPKT